MDYSKLTLGELLSSENETIKRHATGILKQLQKEATYKIFMELKKKGRLLTEKEEKEIINRL